MFIVRPVSAMIPSFQVTEESLTAETGLVIKFNLELALLTTSYHDELTLYRRKINNILNVEWWLCATSCNPDFTKVYFAVLPQCYGIYKETSWTDCGKKIRMMTHFSVMFRRYIYILYQVNFFLILGHSSLEERISATGCLDVG